MRLFARVRRQADPAVTMISGPRPWMGRRASSTGQGLDLQRQDPVRRQPGNGNLGQSESPRQGSADESASSIDGPARHFLRSGSRIRRSPGSEPGKGSRGPAIGNLTSGASWIEPRRDERSDSNGELGSEARAVRKWNSTGRRMMINVPGWVPGAARGESRMIGCQS